MAVNVENEDVQFDQNAADKLAEGLLTIYQPGLDKVKCQLDELTKKQNNLIINLEEENKKVSNPETSKTLIEMHAKLKAYTTKLTGVKKDMHQISEKTAEIKKRALRLQAAKQKEALHRENQREVQLQREQELIGKPATSNVTTP